MIDELQSRECMSRHIWSGTIHRLFRSLELQDHPAASEISESLAVFCQEHSRMPDHILSILMAHSFCMLGDVAAAERILRHHRSYGRHTDSWINILSIEDPFVGLYPLFFARAVRPLDLNCAGRTWVLDLEKIQLTDADRHELILFQTVRCLIEKISNVWKRSDGQGVLGVKGLSRFSGAAYPRDERNIQQLLDYMHDVLERCTRRNGWGHCPTVLRINP